MSDTLPSANASHDPRSGSGSPEMRGALNRWCRSTTAPAIPTLAVRQINVSCARRDCIQVRLVARVSGRRVEIWQTGEDGLSALTNALERFDLRCARVSVVALLREEAGVEPVLLPAAELSATLAE